jgi:hypothetical protein
MATICINEASAFLEQHRQGFFDDAQHREVEAALAAQALQGEVGEYTFPDGSVLEIDAYECSVTAHPGAKQKAI